MHLLNQYKASLNRVEHSTQIYGASCNTLVPTVEHSTYII